ncbi:MAG: DUF4276 family protein [Lachnospiraceae bacterium]
MYVQFLIEDHSTEILVNHVMQKLIIQYPDASVLWDIKSFKGIGHVPKKGKIMERKTGMLLNDLPQYLRGFDQVLRNMKKSIIIVVLDNDTRDTEEFQTKLNQLAQSCQMQTDYAFCIAVKEMEAWLLGDQAAMQEAYPNCKMNVVQKYEQDSISPTWEVIADAVYPGGRKKLEKNAAGAYAEIGKAKAEWAENIGKKMHLHQNISPSFQIFLKTVEERIRLEMQ